MTQPDETHDPALQSWVESANQSDTDFPIQNLPWVSFRRPGEEQVRLGVAIGDQILHGAQALAGVASMDVLLSLPGKRRVQLRQQISAYLARYVAGAQRSLLPQSSVELLLPCRIGDYTDFYASLDHALNVGRKFRPDNPLFPNYKWMPIAYHGRSSSIVSSGTPIRRPRGQLMKDGAAAPVYAPTESLDYEVELGAFLGPASTMGEPIPIARAEEHLIGVCLLNDWSARDIQRWEYQPLGPFLAKNFATSLSPWLVTREALVPFLCSPPPRAAGDPEPLPHLRTDSGAYRITLEAWLRPADASEPRRMSQGDFSTMYWTLGQMIAHHTSNGCPIRPGDLIGSGTVSGPEEHNRGCLLELTPGHFLQDGDEVILRAYCRQAGFRRIGFGECRGIVLPALPAQS